MISTTCHCGAVRLSLPSRPETLTMCDCSICRRYGALWAYYAAPDVQIEAGPQATEEYAWGTRSIAFVRCRACGCITHWRPLPGRRSQRMGVNARNFTPEQIGPVPVRLLDGAMTETCIGILQP